MNTAADILTYAQNHDIRLIADDGQIKINAPENVLTDEFLESAKQHKSEILEVLTKEDRSDPKLMERISDACTDIDMTPEQFIRVLNSKGRGQRKRLSDYYMYLIRNVLKIYIGKSDCQPIIEKPLNWGFLPSVTQINCSLYPKPCNTFPIVSTYTRVKDFHNLGVSLCVASLSPWFYPHTINYIYIYILFTLR